jgi:hypothetical protein
VHDSPSATLLHEARQNVVHLDVVADARLENRAALGTSATKHYDRMKERLTQDEVERIRL